MTTLETLFQLLPEGWEEAYFTCGGAKRKRKIQDPKDWMKLCLIYLMENCSMVQLSAIASMMEIAEISDVALIQRFAACRKWFEWMITHLCASTKPTVSYEKPAVLTSYRILAVDGTTIMEKGALPKEWHLHYALDIFTLTTAQVTITNGKIGESLKQYQVEPKDLILGDRAYGNKVSMKCCLDQGADFIFRMKHHAFELYDENLKKIDLDKELKNLEEGEIFDRACFVLQDRHTRQPVRIVAKRYNEEEREKEQKRVQKNEKRRQKELSKGAKAFHDCMVFVTSLQEEIGAEEILKIYRLRWQVELVFKRLKSILGIGTMPNKKVEHIHTWLTGKIVVALLLEKELGELNCFP